MNNFSTPTWEQLRQLEERIQNLEQALKPFAKLYMWFGVDNLLQDDVETVYDTPDGKFITVGDLRTAYKLLENS